MKARLPQGPSMNDMLRQAQKMQEDMQQKQAELEAREYDISAGGGMVKIKINGKKEIVEMTIDPMIVDPDDIETLTDVITAGVNEAIKTVEDTSAKEMEKITGGLGGLGGGIPGLF
ncbi:MAG: YbaB/EbfC family nucleoid-associated protein [Clostridia bacterium]|nr:YbaB/EbfC family nucleoid-associated protein [Clostridia bacterium]